MDRYEQLFDYLPDAVFVLNRDRTIRRANARSAELFGYERDELVGMPFEALVPTRASPGTRDTVRCVFKGPRAGSMSPGMSHAGLCKDESTFPAELSLRRRCTADNQTSSAW
jgi:two-component system, NarL family, sensor histidine kinase DevS